ncbi:hypothetical protein [Alicyclobacillus kakegawensis]|uniref:hypothetical protein n=1 Tax=Alicyclobacillus kakegawensis TaxID=392012 RepID=UPI0008362181|nr:hypothetical protein [Alicyclobacillus kakegawensis]
MAKHEIDLGTTDMKTALRVMMAESGVSGFAEVARALDMKETTLRSAVTRGALRIEDFKRIAAVMGYTVVAKPRGEE